jgi:thiamine kinase-like enzyme
MLRKIHHSEPLLTMLRRLEKTPLLPENLFKIVINQLDKDVLILPEVKKTIDFLKREQENVYSEMKVVCHGDVNHNNWLLAENNQLYLIDWDGAMIADPAIDLGLLLYWYIQEEQWGDWLAMYGTKMTEHLKLRMKWYVALQTLTSVQWHKSKKHFQEMNKWVQFLTSIL